MEVKNKKASFDYQFIDTLVAGIVLTGDNIKAIRAGKSSLSDTFCYFNNGEIFIKNLYIGPYNTYGVKSDEFRGDKKLLLNKSEIIKWSDKVKQKGYTIVPSKLFINDKGLCKVVINLATGKKNYDKRSSIKERDIERQMRREI